MYSLQGLLALMRAVFLDVCQRLMVVSYCMPGSPHCQVASAMACMMSLAFYGSGVEGSVGVDGGHELVGDADGVVGVLEEDGAVGFGVGAGAVVAGLDEGPCLLLLADLAVDEVDDVGVVDVEDDHLGGAT